MPTILPAKSLNDRTLSIKIPLRRYLLLGCVTVVYGAVFPGCAHANSDPLDRDLPKAGQDSDSHGGHDDHGGHGSAPKQAVKPPAHAASKGNGDHAPNEGGGHGMPAPKPGKKAEEKAGKPAASGGHGVAQALTPADAQLAAGAALVKLKEGNERYVTENAGHPRQNRARRGEVAKGQKPFAVVITCADSRVPPEILFDQGLGDLFVIRTAGEVMDAAALGSIEYAVDHLDVALVVVLGHERCGAVDAACKKVVTQDHIDYLVKAIEPAVVVAQKKSGDLLANAISANVDRVVDELKGSWPTLATRYRDGRLQVIGAVYDLDMGIVQFQ